MKTKLLLLSLLTAVFTTQIQAQNRTSVNAMNAEISDNLDLRAVADIFGDSRDLQDFERRLNDPELQISNLDLNNDNEVDYLRVIETVENRTHLIIVQSVIDEDVYQDVATIDVEKDRNNKIHVQIVGNEFMYGQNYIYQPVYYNTPVIYASFWSTNYRPYYSTWNWNYYPSYYYAWNPFPVFRYRNNININLNINNNYNYVNNRRSNRGVVLYNSRRSNGYERQHPNASFSRRNDNVNNRYELDQRRVSRNETSYSNRRAIVQRGTSQNRTSPSRQRTESSRDYSQNRTSPSRQVTPQRPESSREYSQNRTSPSRQALPQRAESSREYFENRTSPSRQVTPQRAESQNRGNTSRPSAPQRTESQRGNSSSRNENRRS
ncbi:hypothetical protein EKM02_12365 [Flavobacterium sp. RSP49]|uniref:hypothetical protein n=1 Tax=unclassified Flavobacterium TaxID=196869 RepID=UPI000F837927|nr:MULTISPECIES: hypothetical protein [unclassified Flavobacterium]RTY87703.1 hypothetical protein EKM00_05275 [Flavobacterium sp. RSP15]RTY98129.1 hypothetical protein EKM02_12365 [Flavobacterium sp. RSP49]